MPKERFKQESEDLLTVVDVARILRVPRSWVYEHTRPRASLRLPHLKLGKYLRFRRNDVLQFVGRIARNAKQRESGPGRERRP